jgi:hypothetical protein
VSEADTGRPAFLIVAGSGQRLKEQQLEWDGKKFETL